MGQNVIKSVSIPQDLADFLDRNPELSLSKIVQSKLIEIMQTKTAYENRIRVYENKMHVLQTKLFEANEEIEKLKNGGTTIN